MAFQAVAFKNSARRSTATGSIAVNECGIQLSAPWAEAGNSGGWPVAEVFHQQNSLELPPSRKMPSGASVLNSETSSRLSAAKKVGSPS